MLRKQGFLFTVFTLSVLFLAFSACNQNPDNGGSDVKKYKVTFITNGESVVSSQEVAKGRFVREPTAPIKAGYTFGGWYEDSGLINLWNFAIDKVTSDVTLYAKWVGNTYTVRFNADGATTEAVPSTITVTVPATIIDELPTAPTKDGFYFGGWFTANEGGGSEFTASTVVTASITVYAKWSAVPVFTVEFDVDGGSFVDSQSIAENDKAVRPVTDPTKVGYTFVNWYADEDKTIVYDFDTAIASVKTIYAKWDIDTYTISYTLNGGSATNPTSYTVETDTFTLTNPTRDGYTFVGWSGTGLTGTNNTIVTITKGSTGNREYTANWFFIYSISYTLNGGSATNPTTYTVETNSFTLANPTRVGYTFVGWSATDLTGTNNTTVTITKGSTGNREYTANWALNYTISYTLNSGTATNPTSYTAETENFTLNNPIRTGYTFVGWSGTDLTGTNNTTVTITKGSTGNKSYTAHWVYDFSSISYRDLVYVNGGTYNQKATGGTPDNFDHTISNFSIGQYEVTYELWYTVHQWAIANGYTFFNAGKEGHDGTIGAAPSTAPTKFEPVTTINWRDIIVWCNAYSEMSGLTPVYTYSSTIIKNSLNSNATACDNAICNWSANGYRLPTEGEWQYAASNKGATPFNYASGGTGAFTGSEATNYPHFNPFAWYGCQPSPCGNTTKTQAVGGKTPNELGIYDMSGNVFEWCWDWNANYPGSAQENYIGPTSGTARILRGGSWVAASASLQVGWRSYATPDKVWNGEFHYGFRIARYN